MNIAIITGVTSGLGYEFLKTVTTTYPSIDEVWVIARREDKLIEISKQFDMKIRPVTLDLTKTDSIEKIKEMLNEHSPNVQILINNAGFGELGNFYENDYLNQLKMIDLNNGALTAMCTVCAKFMSPGSFIINVASIASFVPNPRMAVYCSTKAYVKSFTRCIREELKPRKINAFVVCPGPMSTEFLDVAGISGGQSKTFEILPYTKPEKVAKNSVELAARGRGVYTPGAFYKFYRILSKLLPHSLLMKVSKT